MCPALRVFVVILSSILSATCAVASGEVQVGGPGAFPTQLHGPWKISLCGTWRHNWIRFENVETGEVHTASRYNRGRGGMRSSSGKQIWPDAPATGVTWDMDLKYEPDVARGKHILRSCYVRDPLTYLGKHRGRGHLYVWLNCASYTRNAWTFYTGERYCLFPVAAPCLLNHAVRMRNRCCR